MSPWTAPPVERHPPDRLADERAALEELLDSQRETLLGKCSGLDGTQLTRAAVPPSNLTLLGLVRHLTEVERWWFRQHVEGADLPEVYCTPQWRDADFEDLHADRAEAEMAAYVAELDLARAGAATRSLDDVVPSRGHHPEQTRNVRWIYLHMIDEYGRHNGHADLLREAIDGSKGQ
jgi:hypothetical protein